MNESFRNFIVRESTGDESAGTPQHSPLKYLYDRGRRSVYSAPSRPLQTTEESALGKATEQATAVASVEAQPLVAAQPATDADKGPPSLAQRVPSSQCATGATAPPTTHAYRTDILERHLSALRDIDRRLDALQQRDHQISERILRTEQQLMRVQAIIDNATQAYRARDWQERQQKEQQQQQQQQFEQKSVFDRLSMTTEASSRGAEYGDLMWALIIVGGVVAVLLTVMIALSVRREQQRQRERKRAQQRSERRQDIQRAVLDALSQSQQPSLLQSRRGALVSSTATRPAYDDASLTPSSPLLVGP